MEVVVPLAGPDFELANGSTKAELLVDGEPLLLHTLHSRSWWQRGDVTAKDFCFVLRDTPVSRTFATETLSQWFPLARTIFLSHATAGAAFSALAGVAACDPDKVLCVDLADILYDEDIDAGAAFGADPQLGGMVPTFPSTAPVYSYVELGGDGRAIRTAEKAVISDRASAGTYFFRNAGVYTAAVAHAIGDRDNQVYRGIYFVCPLFNGVIAAGYDVRTAAVTLVQDIKVATA